VKDQPERLFQLVCPIKVRVIVLDELEFFNLLVRAVFRVMT